MKQKIKFKDENILKYFTYFQLRANEHSNSQQCCVCLHGALAYYRVKVYVIGIA